MARGIGKAYSFTSVRSWKHGLIFTGNFSLLKVAYTDSVLINSYFNVQNYTFMRKIGTSQL